MQPSLNAGSKVRATLQHQQHYKRLAKSITVQA